MLESLRPGPPQGIRDVLHTCGGQIAGVSVEASRLRQVVVRELGAMEGQRVRRQSSRRMVNVAGSGGVHGDLWKRKGSPNSRSAGLPCLLALAGYELVDPEQAGPHAVMVAGLAGTGRSLLHGQGPL